MGVGAEDAIIDGMMIQSSAWMSGPSAGMTRDVGPLKSDGNKLFVRILFELEGC
jgi:hypothetical protein